MEIEESLIKLRGKLDRRGSPTSTTNLYTEQVAAKFKGALYSIQKLRELEQPVIAGSDKGSQELLSHVDKVNFYCDCFWDFLRSSIDILAQLINALTGSPLSETSVDIKQVARSLTSSPYANVKTSVDRLLALRAFSTLEEYRNCSTHRRQVFIDTRKLDTEALGTRGYRDLIDSSTSKGAVYISHICSNPWDLTPDVDNSRVVATFCEELLKKIEKQMVTIINRLA